MKKKEIKPQTREAVQVALKMLLYSSAKMAGTLLILSDNKKDYEKKIQSSVEKTADLILKKLSHNLIYKK